MLDTATRNVIEGIVLRRIKLGQDWQQDMSQPLDPDAIFTALHVSREAQAQYQIHNRHSNMKDVVHELFDSGQLVGYQRSLEEVEAGTPKAWVYYPQFADPKTCQPAPARPGTATTVSTVTTAPIPQLPSPVAPLNGNAVATAATGLGGHQIDKRGRLWVPTAMIAGLGLKRSEWAYAMPGTQQVIVTKDDPQDASSYRYRVDKSGNIPLSRSCLNKGGLVGNSFDVVKVNDTVIIKAP